jgi:exonuclease SbcC
MLEDELRVGRGELDYDECRLRVVEADRRRTVCDYAAPVLESVRENILRAVLPGTIEHMRAMLPLLTCGRYHDCELDDETYKIRVWDARAGDYVEKEIFSGATQDQFSLALRLAFALATLPQGLGARPKFIFLDEPTAGFDGERRTAFVKLLTDGELAARFDQIFLISPEGIFDTNPLRHYVRLSGGKIVEENVSGAATECIVQ